MMLGRDYFQTNKIQNRERERGGGQNILLQLPPEVIPWKHGAGDVHGKIGQLNKTQERIFYTVLRGHNFSFFERSLL